MKGMFFSYLCFAFAGLLAAITKNMELVLFNGFMIIGTALTNIAFTLERNNDTDN